MDHRLIGGRLSGEDKGVIARCECGWDSGHRISSFAASNAFSDHQDTARRGKFVDRDQEKHPWKGPGPMPAKWTADDGTIVYRSYADYCDD